jgi:glycerate-2-kinase
MALAAAEVLSDPPHLGWISRLQNFGRVVIIKDDHATKEEIKTLHEKYNILVWSASHLVPDARSIVAATGVLKLASSSDSRMLIVACISGGGSALFCSSRDALTLGNLMAVNCRLLESGMPIKHMPVICKQLENGKGERLAGIVLDSERYHRRPLGFDRVGADGARQWQ